MYLAALRAAPLTAGEQRPGECDAARLLARGVRCAAPRSLGVGEWTIAVEAAYAPSAPARRQTGARLNDSEAELHALMVRGLAGDAGAHKALLSILGTRFRVFFRSRMRVGDPSYIEDLVQETLIAIHTRRESYNPEQPLRAWVYAIARYKLIDHFRRSRSAGVSVPIDEIDGLFSQDVADAADPARDVAGLLALLPLKQRTAIRLVKLEERSVKEAATLTGMSESDIKVSIHRGMKRLSALVAKAAQP